jgi:predicted nucleotidyltransferase
MNNRIILPKEQIADFCRRWRIEELSIFGSALREDFRPDSDVDILIVFRKEAKWSLFDVIDAEYELEQIIGRKVDLVEKKALRNPFRRHHILTHREVLYAA